MGVTLAQASVDKSKLLVEGRAFFKDMARGRLSMLLLDMLYGLCQLLGIVAPRRINLKLHQISFFNTKAVGCRSWHALTSAINVQFA